VKSVTLKPEKALEPTGLLLLRVLDNEAAPLPTTKEIRKAARYARLRIGELASVAQAEGQRNLRLLAALSEPGRDLSDYAADGGFDPETRSVFKALARNVSAVIRDGR
jgi:hypothetical protein